MMVTLFPSMTDVRALPGVGISRGVLVDINLTMPDRCLDPVLDEVMPTADGDHVRPAVVQDVRKCLLRDSCSGDMMG